MAILEKVLLVLLGIVIAVGLFCLVVAIACAVNGIGFGAQITQWFGQEPTAVASIESLIGSHIVL